MPKKINTKLILKAQHHYVTLLSIADKAAVWNNTTYKKANDELYALLSECYASAADIRSQSTAVVRELNSLLLIKNITFNDGTRLETKVVRVVFGDIGKRAHTYARVLRNAFEQSVQPTDFVTWLEAEGGVEAVRKQQKGLSPTQVKEKLVEKAEKALPSVKAKQLSNAPKMDGCDYVLAVVQHTNGKQRIVGFCENLTLVKQALAKLANEAEQQATKDTLANLERERRTLQQQIAKTSTQASKAA